MLAMEKLVLLIISCIIFVANGQSLGDSRPSVVVVNETSALTFHGLDGKLFWAWINRDLNKQEPIYKVKWNPIVPAFPSNTRFCSNPVTVTPVPGRAALFIQGCDGQVYGLNVTSLLNDQIEPTKWFQVGPNLPFHGYGADIKGSDGVSAIIFNNLIYVLARSRLNESSLYVSKVSFDLQTSSSWQLIGGDKHHLITDVAIAYNTFSKLLEAFMVSTDGYLYRTWQVSPSKWVTWDKTGYFAPKTNTRPVVHIMAPNFFNGFLNVFIHGLDGYTHHIWQTTCDHVPNVWGWCTWSTWNTIGGRMPVSAQGVSNTLSIGANIHRGIEVFMTTEHGHLYKMWQTTRHSGWSEWEKVTMETDYHLATLPAVINDATGWWSAYGLDASRNVYVITQTKEMKLSTDSLLTGGEVTVEWDMPVDEASHSDWIGVYPHGSTDNKNYVDFYYVGGTQNPLKDAVPQGKITLKTFLPEGKYDYRYLVDRRYVAAVGTSLSVTSSPEEEVWVQIYRGLFEGMQIQNVSVETCVHDAQMVEKDLKAAFDAFEDRAIYKGLQMLGQSLLEVAETVKDCAIDKEINKAVSFFKDLVECCEGSCKSFLVDILKEVLVLYENIYEIYGDIHGAKNAFKIKAYYQGGYNIGRVINGAILAKIR